MQRIPERLLRAVPSPELVVRAPGRANLIGEHTDYNGGFVLPVALELATYVAGVRRDGVVSLRSSDQPGQVAVDPRDGAGPTEGWGRYATAVVRALRDDGVPIAGFEGVVASQVPIGAGLSSSAALEVAIAHAVAASPVTPKRVALACHRAENVYVGTRCGVMDQLASACATAGHALLVDCRDVTVQPIPLPSEIAVVVVDSGLRRELAESAYNERVAESARAAEALGIDSLRDATCDDLERIDDPTLRRRARHVVGENTRVLAAAEALRARDTDRLASLFRASHESLARDYEVSTPELDLLVAIADSTPGVLAARLTGAGFGGCTVNLVRADAVEAAGREIVRRYGAETGLDARFWLSRPAAGAGRVS